MNLRKRTIFSIGLGILLLLLIAGRLALPSFVISYVNKTLNEIPGYSGSIADVEISLYRGAYTIDSLVLKTTDGASPQPFVSVPLMDLSVHWKALFDGAIVGEVEAEGVELHFVTGQEDGEDQYGEGVDWTEPIKELMPLQINRLAITNGTIFYHDYASTPEVELDISHVELLVTNLSNAKKQDSLLPTAIQMTGNSIGGGELRIGGRMNPLKITPDIDLDISFESVELPALNDFLNAYAAIDAESGAFSLYSEVAVKDSQIQGYLKPIVRDLSIVSWQQDKNKPLKLLWEGISAFISEILENQPKDQFATKVPLSGTLDNTHTGIFLAVANIFKNAFFKAFELKVDETISIGGSEKPAE